MCQRNAHVPVQPLVCNQYATHTSHDRTNTRQFERLDAPLPIKTRTFMGSFAPNWFAQGMTTPSHDPLQQN
jgi:hypothetical protein